MAHKRDALLADVEELTLPYDPLECEHTYYLYTVLVPESCAGEKRDRIIENMDKEYGVKCIVANRAVLSGSQGITRPHRRTTSPPVPNKSAHA